MCDTEIKNQYATVLRSAAAKSLQSCSTLCDPIDISPPGSPAPGILQARTLEWVAISFSSAWKWKSESEVAQSCPTLSDRMDCSPPGSSIHGIFQARELEWGAIAFSIIYSEYKQKTSEGMREPKSSWEFWKPSGNSVLCSSLLCSLYWFLIYH